MLHCYKNNINNDAAAADDDDIFWTVKFIWITLSGIGLGLVIVNTKQIMKVAVRLGSLGIVLKELCKNAVRIEGLTVTTIYIIAWGG